MRVLLINPHYPISETPSPPLGLAFLAAALRQADIAVRILDYVVFPYRPQELRQELADFDPDIVGATAVSMNYYQAMDILRTVKRLNPQIFTIIGGPHVTFRAEETLGKHAELDCVVIGEGEATLVELVRTVTAKGDLNHVKGIAFRNGNAVRRTPARDPIELNRLPLPARDLLPLGRYRALGLPLTVTTSRGCPYHCIFCVGRKMGGAGVRYRHASAVGEELEALSRLGFRQVNLADDLFTANNAHCRAVCDEIVRRNLSLTWTAFARVDSITPEILCKMRTAGCTAVSFGLESANAGILKTIRKGITADQVVDAARMCRAAGIQAYGSFILGLPGESPATIQETLDFAERLQGEGLAYGFHLLAPFPGTEARKHSRAYGLRILSDDWSEYHANRSVVETKLAKKQVLDAVVIGWEERYLAYLADIQRRMRIGESSPDENMQIINLERIAIVYDLMINSAVETEGTWSLAEAPPERSPLEALSQRLTRKVKHPHEKLHDALQDAVAGGDLKFEAADGKLVWAWVNYLPLEGSR
jgi:radical SAM superfamily enzyme YgiQ (UPF0313 family)